MFYLILASLTLCFTLIGMEGIETNYLPEDLTDALTLAEGYSNEGYVNKVWAEKVATMLRLIKAQQQEINHIHVTPYKYIYAKTTTTINPSILQKWAQLYQGNFAKEPLQLPEFHQYCIAFPNTIDIPYVIEHCRKLKQVVQVTRGCTMSPPPMNITMQETDKSYCFTFITNDGLLFIGPVEHEEKTFILSKSTFNISLAPQLTTKKNS